MATEILITNPTWVSLIPPLLTIIILLFYKRITVALLVGLLSGVFAGQFSSVTHGFQKTIHIVFKSFGQPSHLFIILFCFFIYAIFTLFYKTGVATKLSTALSDKLNSKRKTSLATIFLGLFFWFDHHLSIFATASLMRPLSDKNKISRAKLAYYLDSMAAPVSLLIPLTFWANDIIIALQKAGMGSQIKAEPFHIILKAALFNIYGFLTIVMVFLVALSRRDFGPMKIAELNATVNGFMGAFEKDQNYQQTLFAGIKHKNIIIFDFVFPFLTFVFSSITFMLLSGESSLLKPNSSFINVLINVNGASALLWSSIITFILTSLYYIARKIITFKEWGQCLGKTILAVGPFMITIGLAFAFSTQILEHIKTADYFKDMFSHATPPAMLPAMLFLISALIAITMGSVIGSYALLFPISITLAMEIVPEQAILLIGAIIAGATCGQHTSPFSVTTFLSSIGAGCQHKKHVSTQLFYNIFVGIITFACFCVAGYMINENNQILTIITSFIAGTLMLTGFFFLITQKPIWSENTKNKVKTSRTNMNKF